MIRLRSLAAAAGLAMAATVASVGPVEAETWYDEWTYSTDESNGNIGWASYNQNTSTLRVDDRERDGYSFYVYFDGPGSDNWSCWDHGGAVGPGGSCDVADKYGTGKYVDVYVCIGEWGDKSEEACEWKTTRYT